jgi:glycosyltransferase involved in cell wall biosynthesis
MKLLQRQQQKVDAFVVHTNLEKIWLISKGFDEKKIHKLSYPCASSMLFEKCAKDAGKGGSMAGMAEEPDLLYVGRIIRRKGLHVLLQALPSVISDVKGLTVVIAGPTDKRYYKTLSALDRELNLGNHVIFSQALPEEVKYRIMCKCKLFVVPSISDYTPVTLIEAQALGKPVISTITGAIPEIVKNGETGLLVEPDNPMALANALMRLLLREEERQSMSKKAEQWVRQNFLLEKVIDELEKLYIECTGK